MDFADGRKKSNKPGPKRRRLYSLIYRHLERKETNLQYAALHDLVCRPHIRPSSPYRSVAPRRRLCFSKGKYAQKEQGLQQASEEMESPLRHGLGATPKSVLRGCRGASSAHQSGERAELGCPSASNIATWLWDREHTFQSMVPVERAGFLHSDNARRSAVFIDDRSVYQCTKNFKIVRADPERRLSKVENVL